MIKYITIENFRCFKQSTLKGFTKINLIGGLNNSGKSALLEALLLLLSPHNKSIILLNKYRNETITKKNTMDKTWDYLFYNAQKNVPISFQTYNIKDNLEYTLKIKKSENDNFNNTAFYEKLKNDSSLELALKDFEVFTQNKNIIHSLDLYISTKDSPENFIGSFSFTGTGRLTLIDSPITIFNEVAYRASKQSLTNSQIAKLLDTAINQGDFNDIMNTIKIIDNSIEDIRVLENKVQLSRDKKEYIPIGLFGDAITSTLDMILTLFNLENGGYLLIDEVENGIHHSKHLNFIKHISTLALKNNIQVFMTTHSLEFITSFNSYSLQDNPENFSYIELARTRNNQIIGNSIEADVLKEKINNSKNFRGE